MNEEWRGQGPSIERNDRDGEILGNLSRAARHPEQQVIQPTVSGREVQPLIGEDPPGRRRSRGLSPPQRLEQERRRAADDPRAALRVAVAEAVNRGELYRDEFFSSRSFGFAVGDDGDVVLISVWANGAYREARGSLPDPHTRWSPMGSRNTTIQRQEGAEEN